jgi:hypothetical protein
MQTPQVHLIGSLPSAHTSSANSQAQRSPSAERNMKRVSDLGPLRVAEGTSAPRAGLKRREGVGGFGVAQPG